MFIDNNNYKRNHSDIIAHLNAVKNFQSLPGFELYLSVLILTILTT